jgi:type I restriction enzyme, S subunit
MNNQLCPIGWKQSNLGEIATIERESVQPNNIQAGTVFVGLENINGEGHFNDVQYVDIGDIASNKFAFDSRHLLYGKLRPYLKKIARPNFQGICSTDIVPILPSKHIDKSFLYYYLRQPQFIELATTRSTGANLPRLSPKTLAEFPISFPPLKEQKRIAAILDKADAIRRSRKKAIALTEELLRSTFLDMFGDIKANGWEMCKIENITAKHKGSIRTGPFGSQLLHSEFVDEGIAVLGIDNAVQNEFQWAKSRFITQEKYAALKRYTVRPDDVIITIMGTCGRCAIVPHDCPTAINTKHLCCITLDREKCLPEFLHSYFLIHPEARRYLKMNAKGAIMEGLNMTIINNLPIPLVPISLQQRYKDIHQKQYKLKNEIFAVQSNDENLFNSLLQKAFRGEL